MLAAIERGDGADELRPWFSSVVCDHHLSYGHGAIYTQKAFELLDMIGWDRASTVLPYLVPTLVYGTREDKLPYMRPFMKSLGAVDLAALASTRVVDGWADDGSLLAALLGDQRTAPVDATVAALRQGAGVDDVLDVVVRAVSERMLRYDVAGEFDFADDFGWLDITHGLTYANAARWHHRRAVEREGAPPDLLRLVLFTTFLAQWTGRHEWHTGVGERQEIEPLAADLAAYGDELQRQSLLDGTTAFIVHAACGEDEPGCLDRGAARRIVVAARRDRPVHRGAQAGAVRRRHRRALDRLPQRPHPTRLIQGLRDTPVGAGQPKCHANRVGCHARRVR